jgi:hypothetical protein
MAMFEMLASAIACLLLFMLMVVFDRIGERLRRRSDRTESTSVAAGGVFGLLGLLLAFTYSGAFGRLEDRRQFMVDEINAIGTAYLRLDLLPPETQPPLRQLFREYTQVRIDWYHSRKDAELVAALTRANTLQNDIWRQAIAATAAPTVQSQPTANSTRQLVMPALNDMFDIAIKRRGATLAHHPTLVVGALFAVALVASVLAGYSITGDRTRHHVESIAFAAVVAIAVYVILDIDYPRYGLIRLDDINAMMKDLLKSMK